MTKTISFSFNVCNGNEIIAQDKLKYKISEKELREVATVMDGNGGHRVNLCAMEGTDFKTMKALFSEEYHKFVELVEERGYKECAR